VSTVAVWLLLGLGLLALVARRRSTAAALVAAQSLILAAEALRMGLAGEHGLTTAGLVLLVKAVAVGALLGIAVVRSRPERPLAADASAGVRIGAAVIVSLGAAALMPTAGLDPPAAANVAGALLAVGITMLIVRRAAAFQMLGLLVAENGIVVAALAVAGGVPVVVELGAAFDAILVLVVAVAFHGRIHDAFGTTDTDVLTALRD
jgi:hydrogenase-4 component E